MTWKKHWKIRLHSLNRCKKIFWSLRNGWEMRWVKKLLWLVRSRRLRHNKKWGKLKKIRFKIILVNVRRFGKKKEVICSRKFKICLLIRKKQEKNACRKLLLIKKSTMSIKAKLKQPMRKSALCHKDWLNMRLK